MKRILSLAMLFLAVIGGARSQTCNSTISTFPYSENFESGANGWTSGGTNSSWALGKPTKTIINSAASGTKAWITSLTTTYNASEQSFVESPCFNTSTLVQPIIEMKIWWNSEFSVDGAVLQSSIDNGTTWQNVGTFNDGNNWYNDNTLNAGPGGQPAATAVGWTGRNSNGNGSGGWVTAKHILTGLGGKAGVKLRIAFGSSVSVQDEGFAFDDISIYETPANDAGLTAISSPGTLVQPGVSTPVTVTLKNFGTAPLTSATLGFSVNKVMQPTFAWTGSLALNQTATNINIGNYTFPAGTYTVKAWTKLPNGTADGQAANDTVSFLVNSCNALNGTYTINKSQAASATNFTTFAAAIQALTNCGVGGPVIFNVTGGPYTENATIGNISGTSATNTVTINGNGNALVNPSQSADALKLNGTKYFRFNNLKIEADPLVSSGAIVSLLNAAQFNTFNGCTFTHSITTTNTTYVVSLQNGSSNNIFQNNTLIGASYSVYNYGTNTTAFNSSNQFIGNTVKDSYYNGIYAIYAPNTLIEGNDISRPNRPNTGVYYAINISTGCTAYTISKNRIHNTHDAVTTTAGTSLYGITVNPAGILGNENIVKNNAIYNINNNGGSFFGIYNSGSDNTYFYHNTVSADNPNISYVTLRGMYFGSALPNVKFINNNISLTSQATTKHAIYLGAVNAGLTSNNNNLYVGFSGNVGYLGTDKTTLADWKAVNNNFYDQNSVSVDPMYVSLANGNLQPNNPLLNNVGQPLTAVTDDITGTTRSTTNPDPGAFEFTPAGNDAGITAVVSPNAAVAPNSNQPVTVTLKNFGFSPLSSVTINWSINNVAQPAFSWFGNLLSNQTVNVAIGNYTFGSGNYTVSSCTSNPNGSPDPNTGNDCTDKMVMACTSLSGAYTINKNIAASSTNFTSFTAVANTLAGCGISGPVTFDVVAGTGSYNEVISFGNVNGSSATNTLTFNGNANTISSPNAGSDYVIRLDGAKYFRFNNLKAEMNPASITGSVALLMNGADKNIFSGCTLTHSISTTAASNGISLLNGCNDNIFQNNTIIGASYGINNTGTAAVPNISNRFTGNTIKDSRTYGIYCTAAPNTLIEGNDLSRPARTNAIEYYGIFITGNTTETTISKNRIHNTNDVSNTAGSVYGIYNAAAGTPGNENIVKNNVIYNINVAGSTIYGIYNSSGSNTWYYHNTVSFDLPNVTYSSVRGFYVFSTASNVKFINNIISMAGPTTNKTAMYLNAAMINSVSNNNNLYPGPGGKVAYYAGDKISLTDWNTASGFDQNSVSVDPQFVNVITGDLHPTVSPVNNLGQPLASVPDDISGAPRNAATPDPGAYEFSVNPNDVGVIAISGPTLTGCGLSAAETITVTVKNFGDAPQTTFPVTYNVNGTNPVTETWNGTIAPNATATYTFTVSANLATAGTYNITAFTNLATDSKAGNNDTTLTITNSQISTLPITFDFETAATGISRFRKVSNLKSNVVESVNASYGAGSAKGLIMDGIDHANWVSPAGATDPWTNNPDNFAAAYLCIFPAGGAATDSLWLTFDLKQLFKTANVNTNFRVTVNGTQIGSTYRPPFSGTPINWQKVKVDLTPYKNNPFVLIGLESSVKEAYANGTGTANLLDNIVIKRRIINGIKTDALANQIHVFPNPSNGQFTIDLPEGKKYQLEICDLTGKILKTQTAASGATHLKIEGATKGIYLLKIVSQGSMVVRKLIVE